MLYFLGPCLLLNNKPMQLSLTNFLELPGPGRFCNQLLKTIPSFFVRNHGLKGQHGFECKRGWFLFVGCPHIRNFSWGRNYFQFHYEEINPQNPSRHGKSAVAVAAKHPKQSSGIGTEGRFHRPLWGEKGISKRRAVWWLQTFIVTTVS